MSFLAPTMQRRQQLIPNPHPFPRIVFSHQKTLLILCELLSCLFVGFNAFRHWDVSEKKSLSSETAKPFMCIRSGEESFSVHHRRNVRQPRPIKFNKPTWMTQEFLSSSPLGCCSMYLLARCLFHLCSKSGASPAKGVPGSETRRN